MENLSQKFSDYFEYFESLRRKLYSLAIAFFVFFFFGFFEAGNILRVIIHIFDLHDASIVTTSPFQFLSLATTIGMYVGIIFCLPLFLYHLYDFLKDGLTVREKKLFFILLPIGFLLFLVGFAYCFAILYFYLKSVSIINVSFGLQNVWDISSFLSQVIVASTCLGLVFQFPIILTFLIRVGLVNIEYLREKRLYANCAIFIFVGLLPPPDIFSTFLEAIPLVLLYQATLWVNSIFFSEQIHRSGVHHGEKINILEFET